MFNSIQKNKKHNKSLTGFTLVEVIVAMVILTMVTAGLLSVFLSSHRFVVRAKARLFAINQARIIAETLRNSVRKDKWDCVGSYPDCPLGLTAPAGQWIQVKDNAKYKVENTSGDYRKVTIQISYKPPNI